VVLRLIEDAPDYLEPGGRLIVEIDPDQLSRATRAAERAFPMGSIASATDVLGAPRALIVDAAVMPAKRDLCITM
jgi:methylase of polypeptide subunit release factors